MKKLDLDIKSFLQEVTPMIWKLANRYYFPFSERIDIVDECLTIVFVKTLKKYDHRRGASFKTYFYWQVRSFLSNKYKYFNRKKRKHVSCSTENKDIYVRCGRMGKVNLQNLLYSVNSID